MTSTAVQVVRWLTRIFNAYIALMMTILVVSSLFPDSMGRTNPLGYLIFPVFLFSTILAYSREGLAGVLILVTWVVQVIIGVFTLVGEVSPGIVFLGIAVQSIPFLLIGTMYLVCWWHSEDPSVRELGFIGFLRSYVHLIKYRLGF